MAHILPPAMLALHLGGCAGQVFPQTATATSEKAASADVRGQAHAADAALVAQAKADPGDADRAIKAARSLRAAGRRDEAFALLDKATALQPKHAALAREQGLLALELGRIDRSRDLLGSALANGKPDWQTYSGLGAALASAGRQQEAQVQFAKALELAPDNPAILNNLALSYALDGKPAEAERVLRLAASAKGAPAEIKQNLALVLGVRGKLPEAQKLAAADLPKVDAASNAAYIQSLATQAGLGKDNDKSIRSASTQRSGPPYMLGNAPQQ